MLINLKYYIQCTCIAESNIKITFEEYLNEFDFILSTIQEYLTCFFPKASNKGKIRVLKHYDKDFDSFTEDTQTKEAIEFEIARLSN